jgi:molecular chaperone DnaK (HSP70)
MFRLIGDAAKNQLTTNPENTIFDAKRLIGRDWSDKHVQNDIKFFPFKVVEKNAKPHVQVKKIVIDLINGMKASLWIRIQEGKTDARRPKNN